MKVLMCCNEVDGLGHLSRTLKIARVLQGAVEGVSVLIVTGSPAPHTLVFPSGVDCVKLPSLATETVGSLRSRFLPLPFEEVRYLRERILLETARAYEPDLVIVDRRPVGMKGEILPMLKALTEGRRRSKLVFGWRDVMGPDVVRGEWSADGAMPVLGEMYDEIWIYACQRVYDPLREYGLPEAIARKVRFCGYLGVERPPTSVEETRRELGVADKIFILVTAGGGRFGFPVLDTYLRALEVLPRDLEIFSLMIGGPSLAFGDRERLRRGCARLAALRPERAVTFMDFSVRFLEYMAAADLVVSMAGSNTLTESLALQKRVVVIPRATMLAEQRIRASLFDRLGVVRMLHPEQLSPRSLADAVVRVLDTPGPSRARLEALGVDLHGLSRVRDHVVRLLGIGGKE